MNIEWSYWLLAGSFSAYFVLHSWTASLTLKQWVAKQWPQMMPWYRLGFNALALLLTLPLLLLMILFPGETLWRWQGISFYLSSIVALLALIGFVWSLKYYDMAEFMGTKQLKEHNKSVNDQEHFQISPFHRYVRHPWYFFAMVLIWTRDISTTQFLVYLFVSAYFMIGSRIEEKKLCIYHGEVYQKYQQKVAAIFPLPWKFLSQQQAQELLDEYQHSK